MILLSDLEAKAIEPLLKREVQKQFTKYCKNNYDNLLDRKDSEIIELFECDASKTLLHQIRVLKSISGVLDIKPKF